MPNSENHLDIEDKNIKNKKNHIYYFYWKQSWFIRSNAGN